MLLGFVGTVTGHLQLQNPNIPNCQVELIKELEEQDSLRQQILKEKALLADIKSLHAQFKAEELAYQNEQSEKQANLQTRKETLEKARSDAEVEKKNKKEEVQADLGTKARLQDQRIDDLEKHIEKLKEMIVAIKLERNFTKEEILALYLNTVEYSDHVYGIRNASRTFFQKDAFRLNVAESAVLVGMLKATGTYNPRVNPKQALDRRNTVIDQMVRNNYLSATEANKVKLVPIKLDYEKMNHNTNLAPYFIDVLRNDIRQWCKDHKNPKTGEAYNIYKDGLKIYTTIDPRMQLYAEM
ncbi:MAG: penicillin-binding protein, partial [Sphingobacteriales bacterium]